MHRLDKRVSRADTLYQAVHAGYRHGTLVQMLYDIQCRYLEVHPCITNRAFNRLSAFCLDTKLEPGGIRYAPLGYTSSWFQLFLPLRGMYDVRVDGRDSDVCICVFSPEPGAVEAAYSSGKSCDGGTVFIVVGEIG